MEHVPILIAGGGLAGLSAAVALAADGHEVTLVDPAPPPAPGEARGIDRRTTAILQPGRDMLAAAGAWEMDVAPTPLAEMRVLDLRAGARAAFVAAEISDRPFGWNVVNGSLRRSLSARAAGLGVRHVTGAVRGLLVREAEALVTLEDGTRLRCDLVIGADGKESRVRAAAGIDARTLRTGQKALSFAASHDVPHACVSTEIYDAGGPMVLVPLPDADGEHRSAVVWMVPGGEARALDEMDEDAFAAAATARSGGVLGALHPVGERAAWPIVTRVADRFDGPRVALMAEAAHAVPPIGAQGLNMSLADVAALRLACAKGVGERAALAAYGRARRPDVLMRVAAVTALNAAAIGAGPMGTLRGLGIRALGAAPAARRRLMALGLGV